MAINLAGFLYSDNGTAVQSADVTLVDSGGSSEATTTTNSSGYWSFAEADEDIYDIQITSGSQVRRIKGLDKISISEIDVRNGAAATTGAFTFTNTTNAVANRVGTFRNLNSTRADGDEIYISFNLQNDAGEDTEFARITAEAVDVSNGAEDGQLRFGVAKTDGTITDVFTINSTTGGVTDMTMDVSGDINLDADGGDVFFKDGGTTFGSATNNSGNLIIKSGTTTALTFSGADVSVAGDLTISGDDLKMATNTDTYILVADGTSYNPVAISGDVTIANNGAVTIANTAVETAMIAADAITAAKIADDAIDSEHYTDGSIDNAHIADDAIDSEHYAAGSIDTAHIADNQVTLAKIADVARGSIVYGNSSAATAELTKGSANTVLKSDGTDISWGSITVLGTIATGVWQGTAIADAYVADAITISGGTIDNSVIGGTTAAAISATTISASDNITIADGKGLVIDSTPADDAYTGIYGVYANATGSTITAGQVVYMTGTANQVAPARANAAGTMPAVAIAIADVANGASGNFLKYGYAHDASAFVSLTIGGLVYVSDTAAGALDATAPADDGEFVQVLGLGMHGDKMFFNPQLTMVEIA
jgi:hypothetical protein